MSSEVAVWELKGEVEEDGSNEEMNMRPVEVIGQSFLELKEAFEHKDLVEVTRTEKEMNIVICTPVGEEIEFLQIAEHENITLEEAVNDIVQFEEEKAARPEKTEVEFSKLAEVQQVKHGEMRDLIIVPEDTNTATGHQEVENMHLDIEESKPEEEKWAVAPSEEVKEHAAMGTDQSEDIETISHKGVKQAFGHEGVQSATGNQEGKDTKVEMEVFQCEEQKWAGAHLEEILKHKEQREEGVFVMDVKNMARGHQDQSMETKQAQLSVVDVESTSEQNRYMLEQPNQCTTSRSLYVDDVFSHEWYLFLQNW